MLAQNLSLIRRQPTRPRRAVSDLALDLRSAVLCNLRPARGVVSYLDILQRSGKVAES
jgi:hypothetical protein